MRKIILFIILCWPLSAHAVGPMMMGGGVAGIAACTVVTGAPSQAVADDFLAGSNVYFVGFTYTPSGNETVCQLDFNLYATNDNTGCTAHIYGKTGTAINLSDEKCHSDSVSPATGWLEFPMVSDCSLTASTAYAVALKCTGGPDYTTPRIHVAAGDGGRTQWVISTGAFIDYEATYLISVKFYRR